jgi:hypothetical protein
MDIYLQNISSIEIDFLVQYVVVLTRGMSSENMFVETIVYCYDKRLARNYINVYVLKF